MGVLRPCGGAWVRRELGVGRGRAVEVAEAKAVRPHALNGWEVPELRGTRAQKAQRYQRCLWNNALQGRAGVNKRYLGQPGAAAVKNLLEKLCYQIKKHEPLPHPSR